MVLKRKVIGEDGKARIITEEVSDVKLARNEERKAAQAARDELLADTPRDATLADVIRELNALKKVLRS